MQTLSEPANVSEADNHDNLNSFDAAAIDATRRMGGQGRRRGGTLGRDVLQAVIDSKLLHGRDSEQIAEVAGCSVASVNKILRGQHSGLSRAQKKSLREARRAPKSGEDSRVEAIAADVQAMRADYKNLMGVVWRLSNTISSMTNVVPRREPQVVRGWVNVYHGGLLGKIYKTRAEAQRELMDGEVSPPLATVFISGTEGEGPRSSTPSPSPPLDFIDSPYRP